MGPAVRLVDSAEETAREVEALLAAERLLAPAARRRGRPSPRFFVSDAPARFKRLARRLLGLAVGKVGVRRID